MIEYDYIVLGGGINGRSAALALAKRGLNVGLLEQFNDGHIRGSSHGDSRIIRYLYSYARYTQLMPAAYANWKWLEEATKYQLFYNTKMLNISSSEDDSVTGISKILSNHQIPHQIYSDTEVNKIFPLTLKTDEAAVLEETGGILVASLCLRAELEVFLKLGGKFHPNTKISNLKDNADCVTLEDTNGQLFQCKRLVMACGAWTKQILADQNIDVPLTPIRVDVPFWKVKSEFEGRYHYTCFPAGIHDKGPPQQTLKDEDNDQYHVYWLPEKEYPGLVKVAFHGSFGGEINPEHRDLNQAEASIKVVERMKKFVKEYFPGLEYENGPAVLESCIYTSTPDDDFILDIHPALPNVVIAAGFSGHGFKMASETGEILADLATGVDSKYDLSYFSLKRFDTC